MPSLILTYNTLSVNLCSKHILIKSKKSIRNEQDIIHTSKVPLFDLDRLIISGSPNISVPVLKRLCNLGIPTFFISSKGKWIGSLTPDNNLNAARRIEQYKKSLDPNELLPCARKLIHSKIHNSRRTIQRLATSRKLHQTNSHQNLMVKLKNLKRHAIYAKNHHELRGIEGAAAALYFNTLSKFFPETVPFTERNRRPPKDAANALLSFTYAIVQSEIDGAIRQHGLDSSIGVLHAISPGTPALTVDLLEPFRSSICDLLVLKLLNHKEIKDTDFELNIDNGGIYLKKEAHATYFSAYEQHMTRKFTVTKDQPHQDFRQVIDKQVCQYLKFLGNQSTYDFFKMP